MSENPPTDLTCGDVADIAIDALERTAFVLCERCDDADSLEPASRFVAISYSGEQTGTLVLGASDGFLCELASSILGVEPEDVAPDAEGLDALREMANVICGSLVYRLGSESRPLSLGLPQDCEPSALSNYGVRTLLDAEGERLEILWTSGVCRINAAA